VGNSNAAQYKMTRNVVILGGNYAGITAAKIFLDTVIPRSGPDSFNVTLISSSSHSYFNIGAPRLIVEPEYLKDTIFPVKDSFRKYPQSQLLFAHGTVTAVDLNSRNLIVDDHTTISFDILVIATGARTEDASFKLATTHEASLEAVKKLNESTKLAKKIAVIGGGPTGVETAGELKSHYPEKQVILYTGASQPLDGLANLGYHAAKKLDALGVRIVNGLRVESTKVVSGQTVLRLSDGSTTTVDAVVPAGGLTANSDYLPQSVLDEQGFVITDEFLRVKGYEFVYALGDIVSGISKTTVDLKYVQVSTIASTVLHDLVDNSTKLVAHANPSSLTIAVPISMSGGVGVFKGWGIPNFLVRQAKSKDFMISKAGQFLGVE
jgi:NADH dehydrogenase FAD-containing subunit